MFVFQESTAGKTNFLQCSTDPAKRVWADTDCMGTCGGCTRCPFDPGTAAAAAYGCKEPDEPGYCQVCAADHVCDEGVECVNTHEWTRECDVGKHDPNPDYDCWACSATRQRLCHVDADCRPDPSVGRGPSIYCDYEETGTCSAPPGAACGDECKRTECGEAGGVWTVPTDTELARSGCVAITNEGVPGGVDYREYCDRQTCMDGRTGIKTWKTPAGDTDRFGHASPTAVAVSAAPGPSFGYLFAVDRSNHRVVVFGHDQFFSHVHARVRGVWPPDSKRDLGVRGVRGSSMEHFNHPQALAVSYSAQRMGWLYVADMHNNRVQCFDAHQVFRASIAPVGLVAPHALAVSHSLATMARCML